MEALVETRGATIAAGAVWPSGADVDPAVLHALVTGEATGGRTAAE